METKYLFALRHGERVDKVALHRQPRSYVSHDCPITDLGLIQAQRSALLIEHFVPAGLRFHVVSSPFLRCMQTAAEVAKQLHTAVHVEEGFCEWLSKLDFSQTPLDALVYCRNPPDFGVEVIKSQSFLRPTYPETLPDCFNRTKAAFEQYITHVQEEVLVVVTHLHPVEALSELWSGQRCSYPEENNCLVTLAEMKEGRFSIILSGDHTHAPQYLRD